ncbi:hypothetical protein [Brachyspira innocens]|uniref:hypothetical protein n=1 Tax=Brachyspira innocens TaxID=13264 RepID=UPI0026EF3AF3|nr:hypothetical protein [Brachyspira innocens]
MEYKMDRNYALEIFNPLYEHIYDYEYEEENNASSEIIENIIELIRKERLIIEQDETNDYVLTFKLKSPCKIGANIKEELKLVEPKADDLSKMKSLKEEGVNVFETSIDVLKACSSQADHLLIRQMKAGDLRVAFPVAMLLAAFLDKDKLRYPSKIE